MKVLQINCVYGRGSTGIITAAIHHALLENGHESVVCYGRQSAVKEPCVHKVCNDLFGKVNHGIAMVTGFMYGGCFFSTNRLIARIQKEKPDIVHLQCINGNFVNIYRLVSWLKQSGIPTVLTMHAEFMYTANCAHAGNCTGYTQGCGCCPDYRKHSQSLFWNRTADSYKKMRTAFQKFSGLTVVGPSEWICKRGASSQILAGSRFYTIYNGIDTTVFRTDRSVAEKVKTGKMILMVTPSFDESKGSDLFLKLAEQDKALNTFVVAGAEKPVGYDGPVCFLGRITDREEMADLYASADVTVVCSRLDNYPTVCLESAACGTPVVGFDVGGVAEAIGNGMGCVVPAGDVDAMYAAVKEVCKTPREEWMRRAAPLAESLSDRRMCLDYLALYKEILEGA